MDDLIHEVQLKTEEEKRLLLAHRSHMERRHAAEAGAGEKANISLLRNDAFFRLADQFLASLFEERVVAIVTDINYFNLYNDIFGRHAGNLFLENIAELLRRAAEEYHGICGYIGGDNFCLVVPTKKEDVREVMPDIERLYASLRFPDGFSPAMGVYFSDDCREPMITLYDRALSALAEIKGDYMRHIHYYSPEMHQHQKEDKLIQLQVKEGLAKQEFLFYVQPHAQGELREAHHGPVQCDGGL